MIVKKIPYDTISTNSVRSELFLSKCCCCFTLRTGCFILGYLNLVFNTVHTLALLSLTTYIGVSTHGFDHFDSDEDISTSDLDPFKSDGLHDRYSELEDETPILNQVGIILIAVLCINFAWVLLNIACLVGLHKKRPGPIRLYIGFATGRLMLSLAGFVYLMITTRNTVPSVLSHSIDLVLAVYFILVYYVYTIQLEKESEELKTAGNFETAPTDVAFVYGIKLDKQHLVHV